MEILAAGLNSYSGTGKCDFFLYSWLSWQLMFVVDKLQSGSSIVFPFTLRAQHILYIVTHEHALLQSGVVCEKFKVSKLKPEEIHYAVYSDITT